MGKFDVDMAMYEGPNYSPHEKLQERGGVYLNDRIYIQLEMYDPLQRNEIVLSVQDRLRDRSWQDVSGNVLPFLRPFFRIAILFV